MMAFHIRFTQASRKHRLGRAHVRFVMARVVPTEIVTNQGEQGWLYVGPDERGVELEVIAVEMEGGDLLVIHAMPVAYRDGS